MILAGQRINGSGSRLVRQLLLAGDDAGILEVAQAQIAASARALDVCTAIPGVPGEAERLCRLVELLARRTAVPLLIDSADPDALIAALRACPRPALVNSVNLIDRRHGLDRVLPAALERDAAVIAQTVDAQGVAATAVEKLRMAARLVEILTRDYGLALDSIYLDPVLLPLTGAPNAVAEALAAVRRIKAELPGVRTVLASSNLSFGMAPRQRPALSSVFLHYAAQAGLDMAIVDPAQITECTTLPQRDRAVARALLFPGSMACGP